MTKHIYLHTSNLETLKYLRLDDNFEYLHEYPSSEISFSTANEYGRIKTDQNFYHILVGSIRQENCPWCGSGVISKKIEEGDYFRKSQYCMICLNCGARGPVLNVYPCIEIDPNAMEEIKLLIKQIFETRRQWDCGFVNQYEC